MASFFRTYRTDKNGQRVDGVFAMAFIHNGQYHLTHISIYQDGLIDCWQLVDFEQFKQKVRSGWVVTQPPPGARIGVSFLADFTAADARYWIEPEEFIKEVADEIAKLNGQPTTGQVCGEAWTAYEAAATEQTLSALRQSYEAIPKHNRRYVLGDMDLKDHPIRKVLYPEEYGR